LAGVGYEPFPPRITSPRADSNEFSILWFAARPSGTEDIYKIYAESFRGADHLRRILAEARAIVSDALAAGPRQPKIPSEPKLKENL
jgi:hypothetical protein